MKWKVFPYSIQMTRSGDIELISGKLTNCKVHVFDTDQVMHIRVNPFLTILIEGSASLMRFPPPSRPLIPE